MTLLELARKFRYIREAGPNTGLRVEAIQKWGGGRSGDKWCMEFVWFVLDIFYEGKCPFDREQSVEAFHQLAIGKGWMTDLPIPGDLVISVDTAGRGHHIGFLASLVPFTTLAGNTSADGLDSNGDRVAEHPVFRAHKVFVRLP